MNNNRNNGTTDKKDKIKYVLYLTSTFLDLISDLSRHYERRIFLFFWISRNYENGILDFLSCRVEISISRARHDDTDIDLARHEITSRVKLNLKELSAWVIVTGIPLR